MANAIITIVEDVIMCHVFSDFTAVLNMCAMLHNLCTYELPHLPFLGYWVAIVREAIAFVKHLNLAFFSSWQSFLVIIWLFMMKILATVTQNIIS